MQSLLFSFQGRVNRAKFWLIHLAMWVVLVVVFALIFGSAACARSPMDSHANGKHPLRPKQAKWQIVRRSQWHFMR